MIDRVSRDSLAEKLRQLGSGTISNFQFESGYLRSPVDMAIREIADGLAWGYYCDCEEHRLDGEHALTDGVRRDFARAVLFLKSDLEYRWPPRTGFEAGQAAFRRLITFGLWRPKVVIGDRRFWPFWSSEEYHAALNHAPYLCGSTTRQNA